MFLAVDVGNSQTTLGLFEDGASESTPCRQWRMATDTTDTADELHERLFGYFLMLGLSLDMVSDVAIASVVPVLSLEWQRMMRVVFGHRSSYDQRVARLRHYRCHAQPPRSGCRPYCKCSRSSRYLWCTGYCC